MAIATATAGGQGLFTSWVTGLSETSSTQKESQLGAIRWEGKNCYKYVKYTKGAETILPGAILSYVDYAANTVSGDVSTGQASGAIGAGVLVGTPVDADYCWIQIRGEAGIEIDTGDAVGDILTTLAAADNSATVITAVTSVPCAILLDGTTNLELILCMFPF